MTDLAGERFGNYRLVRQVGHGGFADVYLGTHIYLQTQAAIKILQIQFANDALQSFLSEARTVIQLEHPHIVRILECGVEQKLPFLVMNYAPGGSLRQRYPLGTRMPLERIIQYVSQAASALQYAHARKLIHRDIKPENMLLSQNDALLLSDFGLVLQVQSTNAQTMQEMAGTVPYMAPEQLQGKPQPASDQYALGVVAYEWLSGERPFRGSFVEVASQHVLSTPPPLYGRVPGLAREIEQVVFTALAKNPLERFSSVQAFAEALTLAITPTLSTKEALIPEAVSHPQGLASTPSTASLNVASPSRTTPLYPQASMSFSDLASAQSTDLRNQSGAASIQSTALRSQPGMQFAPRLNQSLHVSHIDEQPTNPVSAVSQSEVFTSIRKMHPTVFSPGAESLLFNNSLSATNQANTPTYISGGKNSHPPVFGAEPLAPHNFNAPLTHYASAEAPSANNTPTFYKEPPLLLQQTLPASTPLSPKTLPASPLLTTKRRRTSQKTLIALITSVLVLTLILFFVFMPLLQPKGRQATGSNTGQVFATMTTTTGQTGGIVGINGTAIPTATRQPTNHQTPTATSTSSPTASTLNVTGVNASVDHSSYHGTCSTPLPLTFTGTIQVASGSSGGTVSYDWLRSDNFRGPVKTVTFNSGDTTKMVTTTWQGPTSNGSKTLWEALEVISPNALTSQHANAQFVCAPPAPVLTVTGVTITPGNTSVDGCSNYTFDMSATITLAANSPGGVVTYTWVHSDGSTRGPLTVSVAAGQQQVVVSDSWTTPIGAGVYSAKVNVSSPNSISSSQTSLFPIFC